MYVDEVLTYESRVRWQLPGLPFMPVWMGLQVRAGGRGSRRIRAIRTT